uniref:Ribosome assembly factor mrt4 n=1 Tax=Ascaris suum TaxID=6253 RepID=F1LDP0_ASCSU
MPRSKREKEVSLTKVKKKTKESKKTLVKDIRDSVDTYANLFVFNVDNMRATKFVEVRQKFKANSRFFFGKNNVMAVALGRDTNTEYANQLSKVSSMLKGQCGLMFTNADKEAVIKYFNEFKESDYARGGQEATETVELPEGPLPQFSFSMEPQLRKLGLPTRLDKGVITLTSNYVICTEGGRLTAEQARLLKLLQYKTSIFKINLLAHWTKISGFKCAV